MTKDKAVKLNSTGKGKGKGKVKPKNVTGTPKIKPLTDSEVMLWAEFMIKHEAPEGKEELIKTLSNQVVTLNDMSSIVDFITRVYDERQIKMIERIEERVAFLDFIVAEELELTAEKYQTLLEKFTKELEKAREAYEAMQEAKEEQATEKELDDQKEAETE